MDKHPTSPPSDTAFLGQRDPQKIRDWLIEYFTAVVDTTMNDGTGGAGEGSALLRAFDTVWTFEEVPRGIMAMMAARDLGQALCVNFWRTYSSQAVDCGCVYCRYGDVLGSPPVRLTAPHGESHAADPPRETLSALPQASDLPAVTPVTHQPITAGQSGDGDVTG